MVFEECDRPSDAISLSSTCRHLRDILASSPIHIINTMLERSVLYYEEAAMIIATSQSHLAISRPITRIHAFIHVEKQADTAVQSTMVYYTTDTKACPGISPDMITRIAPALLRHVYYIVRLCSIAIIDSSGPVWQYCLTLLQRIQKRRMFSFIQAMWAIHNGAAPWSFRKTGRACFPELQRSIAFRCGGRGCPAVQHIETVLLEVFSRSSSLRVLIYVLRNEHDARLRAGCGCQPGTLICDKFPSEPWCSS